MKHIKHLTVLLSAALLLSLLCLPVRAAGPLLDPEEGEAVLPDEEGRIQLSDSMYYDTNSRDFVYPLSDSGQSVHASVANGMIVRGPVDVSGGLLLAYRNGEPYDGSLSGLTEPGEYVIMSQLGSQTLRLFSFTLTAPTSSIIYAYNMPSGMFVTNAFRDEEEIPFERYSVPMQEDGQYHIEYECVATGVGYSLDVTVDRTPPELSFSGSIDERNRVHSALSISGIEAGSTLQVTLDGVPLQVDVSPDGTAQLPDSGQYVINVFDAAGNRSEYVYTVLIYLNAASLFFFILLALCAAAVIVYVFVKRKKLRIG